MILIECSESMESLQSDTEESQYSQPVYDAGKFYTTILEEYICLDC